MIFVTSEKYKGRKILETVLTYSFRKIKMVIKFLRVITDNSNYPFFFMVIYQKRAAKNYRTNHGVF